LFTLRFCLHHVLFLRLLLEKVKVVKFLLFFLARY